MMHNFELRVKPVTKAYGPTYIRALATAQTAHAGTTSDTALTDWAHKYSDPSTPIEDWRTAWSEYLLLTAEEGGNLA